MFIITFLMLLIGHSWFDLFSNRSSYFISTIVMDCMNSIDNLTANNNRIACDGSSFVSYMMNLLNSLYSWLITRRRTWDSM